MKNFLGNTQIPKVPLWFGIICNCIIAVLPVVIAFFPSLLEINILWQLLIAGGIVFCAACCPLSYAQYKSSSDKGEILSIEGDIISYDNIKEVLKGILQEFSDDKLGFQSGHHSDRVTIYIYHKRKRRFFVFGRCSTNPLYRGERRKFYPNKECIGATWRNGWCFDNQGRYKKLAGGRMDAKFYVGKRIDLDGESLAVLLLESENKNRFLEADIKQILSDESIFINCIALLIKNLYDYIPKPDEAERADL